MFNRPAPCPHCGKPVPSADARFCPACGQPLGGGLVRCGQCNTENRSDAKFCKSCGNPLAASAAPQIQRHRWARRSEDFAVRIEADDLPGSLRQGIIVEPGARGMLIERGANRGELPPGEYTLGNIAQRALDWATGGIPERATLLLVDAAPTDFEFHLGGLFSRDPLRLGVTVRLQARVTNAVNFLVNLLKGRERLSVEDLRQYLYPEAAQTVEAFIRQHSVEQLTTDSSLRSRLELALEDALQTTFAQSGLEFLQVRALALNLEQLDHIKGVRSDYALQFAAAEAEAEGRQRFDELQARLDLHALAEETRKVELEERKIVVYQRMRAALTGDKMNELRTQAEFETFLDGVDRQKLLREKERADLLRAWQEQAEDADRARAHLLAKLDVEQDYERRMIGLRLQSDFDRTQLDTEIELARKRADFDFELRRKTATEEMQLEQEKERIAVERHKAQLELERLQREQERSQDEADAMLGMKLLAQMKEIRRLDTEENLRIQRVHELERARELQKLEIEKMEATARLEITRIQTIAGLAPEALIAVSGPEQARLLADLRKTEALKGMGEEQILAMAAEHSPEVARAFQEKYSAIAAGQASEKEREMYERLAGEQKAMLQLLREENDKRMRDVEAANLRSQQSTERAMDRLAETAQAFARGQGNNPVVVVPGAVGPQVIATGAGMVSAAGAKLCPNCGRSVTVEARFCQYCNHKFEGVV